MLMVCPGLAVGDDVEKLAKTKPPEWHVEGWINSPPLKLASLRGKVVLVRWWTAPGCEYCAVTAPALNELHAKCKDRGLVVIGFYHHKSSTPLNPADVARHAKRFGFKFPVAIDTDWRTLHQWWLDSGDREFTGPIFLLDKSGRIRLIHTGGACPPGSADYRELHSKIEKLLKAHEED